MFLTSYYILHYCDYPELVYYIVLALSLISYLGLIVFIPFYLRSIKYGWIFVILISSLSIFTILFNPPSSLIVVPIVTLFWGNFRSHAVVATVLTFSILGTFLVLDHFGYRIFGPSYLYRCAPPENENWIRVTDFRDQMHIELEDGTVLDTYPIGFRKEAFQLSDNEISMRLFDVPLSDLYFRRSKEGVWMTRIGNEFLCNEPHFFPRRVYGYYEWEFPDSLLLSGYDFAPEDKITEIVDDTLYMEQGERRRMRWEKNLPAPPIFDFSVEPTPVHE